MLLQSDSWHNKRSSPLQPFSQWMMTIHYASDVTTASFHQQESGGHFLGLALRQMCGRAALERRFNELINQPQVHALHPVNIANGTCYTKTRHIYTLREP